MSDVTTATPAYLGPLDRRQLMALWTATNLFGELLLYSEHPGLFSLSPAGQAALRQARDFWTMREHAALAVLLQGAALSRPATVEELHRGEWPI
jgi:hypothetical protein